MSFLLLLNVRLEGRGLIKIFLKKQKSVSVCKLHKNQLTVLAKHPHPQTSTVVITAGIDG